MSAHDEDVLERNLQRLFTRAHRPIAPSAEFRDRLARRLERRTSLGKVSAAPRTRPVEEHRGFPWRIVASAAVLLILACGFLGYKALSGGERDPGVIVARGGVAILHSDSRFWQDVDPRLVRNGLDVETGAFDLITPSSVGITVLFGHFGSVVVGPSSHAAIIGNAASPPSVSLVFGSARLENTAGEPAWGLDCPVANVIVERGEIRARLAVCTVGAANEACLIVTLERGAARAGALGLDMHSLHLGVETSISATRVLSALVVDETTASAASRTAALIPGASTDDDPDPALVRDGFATLAGTIESTGGATTIGRYSVTILRDERLPAVATPKRYEFDGAERFSIHPVKPGRYDVYIERAGAVPWIARGIELAPDITHELKVTSSSGVSLTGRIVDARDGTPIENALVIVEDLIPAQVILFDADERHWSASARTNASGAFRLDSLPAGAHVLRATAPGCAAAWTAHTISLDMLPIEMRLGRPGSIAGLVAREDGSPWRGAIVIASFMRTDGGLDRFSYGAGIAGADGRYTISDLPAGEYVMLNALDTAAGRETMASKVARVVAGAITTVNLPDAIDGPSFAGRVLSAAGDPLAGLDVTLQPRGVNDDSSWRAQRSAADGSFLFVGLPAAEYDVYVGENLGLRFVAVESITVTASGRLTHDVRLGSGAVRGRATSGDESITQAFVLLERMERDTFVFAGRARTTDDGSFAFERLHPATYRATVFPDQKGLAPMRSSDLWVAGSDAVAECELRVERGASLVVRVRGERDEPLAGVELTFVDGSGHALSFAATDRTGRDGRYVVDGIPAGIWTICARVNGERFEERIELNVGDDREVVLRPH
ncbi:MAG: carboxypeptidase-like regulatory domain-containing protein [Planctomycetota bacterium]|nr:carboxypeptidase-like regulatory domain-containing protein [Planctomycetota bacterium]